MIPAPLSAAGGQIRAVRSSHKARSQQLHLLHPIMVLYLRLPARASDTDRCAMAPPLTPTQQASVFAPVQLLVNIPRESDDGKGSTAACGNRMRFDCRSMVLRELLAIQISTATPSGVLSSVARSLQVGTRVMKQPMALRKVRRVRCPVHIPTW